MGAYKAAVVTEGGQNLIAQVLATNKALAFTSAKTSNYAYPSGTNITALTGLQDVVQSTQPFKAQAINDNVAQVSVRFDNDGITQQYQIQTIGLYAKIEDGEEILFSVIQAITPDEMPVQSSVSPSAFIYNIQSTVQNASQITITVNPAGTATVQDILDLENPVFDDSGAVAGITSFPNFLSTLVSKMNIFQFYRNLKAGLQFVLHTGQIVNNCMSESPDLPLAAAQGKVLMDLYTQLNSKMLKYESSIFFNKGVTFIQHASNPMVYYITDIDFLPYKGHVIAFTVRLTCSGFANEPFQFALFDPEHPGSSIPVATLHPSSNTPYVQAAAIFKPYDDWGHFYPSINTSTPLDTSRSYGFQIWNLITFKI